MQISKLKKEINDELTTMESQFGDMDVKELALVDRSDRLNITYKTASPLDPRKTALGDIKDKIRDAVRFFNEDFGPLTDAEIRDMCKDVFPQLEGWNDVSNTKIPLNEEIFALLVDRQNPEKLRPAVIVAKMRPAKSLTWTESKEGDALCYDVPAGNFHSCNGAQIKHWKYVNAPSK